jgi:hypothetical protein
MAFMLKIRWDIASGKLAEFKSNRAIVNGSGSRRT